MRRGERGFGRPDLDSAHQIGGLFDPPTQQALGAQPVERMGSGTDVASELDRSHDPCQRFDRRHVAVQHLERLTIVGTDTDFEPDDVLVPVVDDSTHLEPAHLTEQHAVFDHGVGSPGDDQFPERLVCVGDRLRHGPGRRVCCHQLTTIGAPDARSAS